MKESLAELPDDQRPVLVGIEVSGRTAAVRETLAELGLDFFPVLFDDDGSIQAAYGVFGGVPDIFLIDAEGRIAARIAGLARPDRPAAGAHAPGPARRRARCRCCCSSEGYSGNEVCGVCHEDEHATWMFTHHARAFDTLVTHGARATPSASAATWSASASPAASTARSRRPSLEDVGCETCHGRGGPHLSPDFVEGRRLRARLRHLPRPDALARLRLRDLPAAGLPRGERAPAGAALDGEAEAARPSGASARKDLLPTTAQLRRLGRLRELPRDRVRDLVAGRPRAAVATPAEKPTQGGDADCLALPHDRLRTRRAASRPAERWRTHAGPRRASAASPATARAATTSADGRGEDRHDRLARRQVRLLRDPADLRQLPRRRQRSGLRVRGACEKIEHQRHGTIEAGTGKPLGGQRAVALRGRGPDAPTPGRAAPRTPAPAGLSEPWRPDRSPTRPRRPSPAPARLLEELARGGRRGTPDAPALRRRRRAAAQRRRRRGAPRRPSAPPLAATPLPAATPRSAPGTGAPRRTSPRSAHELGECTRCGLAAGPQPDRLRRRQSRRRPDVHRRGARAGGGPPAACPSSAAPASC